MITWNKKPFALNFLNALEILQIENRTENCSAMACFWLFGLQYDHSNHRNRIHTNPSWHLLVLNAHCVISFFSSSENALLPEKEKTEGGWKMCGQPLSVSNSLRQQQQQQQQQQQRQMWFNTMWFWSLHLMPHWRRPLDTQGYASQWIRLQYRKVQNLSIVVHYWILVHWGFPGLGLQNSHHYEFQITEGFELPTIATNCKV